MTTRPLQPSLQPDSPSAPRFRDSCDRLLIVDDDAADRKLMTAALRSADPSILIGEADTLAAAAVAVSQERVDCILLDYHLDRVDACESIDALREAASDPRLPVVVVSGTSDEAKAAAAMGGGAADFLAKDRATGSALIRSVSNACKHAALLRRTDVDRHRLEVANEALLDSHRGVQKITAAISQRLQRHCDALSRELSTQQSERSPAQQELAKLTDFVSSLVDLTAWNLSRFEPAAVSISVASLLSDPRWSAMNGGASDASAIALGDQQVHVDADRLYRDLASLLTALQHRSTNSTDRAAVAVEADPFTDDACLRVDLSGNDEARQLIGTILASPHGFAAAADLGLSLAVRLLAANTASVEVGDDCLLIGLTPA